MGIVTEDHVHCASVDLKLLSRKSSHEILKDNLILHRVIFAMQCNSSIALSAETLCPPPLAV